MLKTLLHFIALYVILVLAQAIVFNHICLFGVAIPLVFIYLIIKLPVTLSVNWVMTIAFVLGLTIDIFSDTQGVNALACTIIAPLRLPLLRLYFPREEEMNTPEPSKRSLGASTFVKYVISMTLVYCTLFFLIEAFSFFDIARTAIKIVASTALTFIIIVAIDALTSQSK